MAEQLCELYAEKEILEAHFPGLSAPQIIEAVKSVRAQLADVLGEPTELPVASHAAEGLDPVPLSDEMDSLEAQLIELYAERQALAEAFPGMEIADLAAAFKSALDRLERFYESTERPLTAAA